MAETLGISGDQVRRMVTDMRARQSLPNPPIPASTWVRTRLWIWVLVALIVLGFSGGGMLSRAFRGISGGAAGKDRPVRLTRDERAGIYHRDKVDLGTRLGFVSPPGFSYEVKVGSIDAAANGSGDNYIEVEGLSKENVAIVQRQWAENVTDALRKAVPQADVKWVNGAAVAQVFLNYFPGGDPVPADFTLHEGDFQPGGDLKSLREQVLKAIQEHWDDIVD